MVKRKCNFVYKIVEDNQEYICETCGKSYDKESTAMACEAQGLKENTKVPKGTIVIYDYTVDGGDYPDTIYERPGIVIGNIKGNSHDYYVEVMDLYDLKIIYTHITALAFPDPDSAEEIYNKAMRMWEEDISVLKMAKTKEDNTEMIRELAQKEREYSRRD